MIPRRVLRRHGVSAGASVGGDTGCRSGPTLGQRRGGEGFEPGSVVEEQPPLGFDHLPTLLAAAQKLLRARVVRGATPGVHGMSARLEVGASALLQGSALGSDFVQPLR
jgi:hypothetical protein